MGLTSTPAGPGEGAGSLQTEKTRGYGMWLAVLTTADGRRIEGSGWSQQLAEYRARIRAQESTR